MFGYCEKYYRFSETIQTREVSDVNWEFSWSVLSNHSRAEKSLVVPVCSETTLKETTSNIDCLKTRSKALCYVTADGSRHCKWVSVKDSFDYLDPIRHTGFCYLKLVLLHDDQVAAVTSNNLLHYPYSYLLTFIFRLSYKSQNSFFKSMFMFAWPSVWHNWPIFTNINMNLIPLN